MERMFRRRRTERYSDFRAILNAVVWIEVPEQLAACASRKAGEPLQKVLPLP